MIRNYLITTFRNLTKHSLYTFINIAGLSLGISISLLIVLYVVHEFEQDRFHQQGDKVYQIIGHVNYGDTPVNVTGMSAQMGPAVLESNPEVTGFFRTFQPSRVVVSADDRHTFYEGQFLFADAALLQTLTFPLVSGGVSTEPMTVVITERAAQKYFGAVDPVGKVITYDHEFLFQVAGVVENPPSTSSLQFDFVGSFTSLASLGERERNFFSQEKVSLGGFSTYLVIPSPDVAAKVAETIPALVTASGIENGDDTFSVSAFLDHSMQRYEANYTFTFLGIALAILALALINYVNLTTARATLRAKEVGIRKVVGARLRSLRLQFYLESAFLTAIAFVLAVAILQVSFPLFLRKLQLDIDVSFLWNTTFVVIMVGLFAVCLILSGTYPALVLSRFKPADIIRGKVGGRGGRSFFRKAFIVVQFTVTITLVICAFTVKDQLAYIRNKNLGLNKEQVMMIPISPDMSMAYAAFKNDIVQLPHVLGTGTSSMTLFKGTDMFFTKSPVTDEEIALPTAVIDEAFVQTLSLTLTTVPETKKYDEALLLNESAVNRLALGDHPVGQKLRLGATDQTVVGVLQDFNYASLRNEIAPLALSIVDEFKPESLARRGGCLYVRITPDGNLSEDIAAIEAAYRKYQSKTPFEYNFLDDAFDAMYKSEDRLAALVNTFSAIAMLIACLGLLGLITLVVEVRTKEIGIRKTLGASVQHITRLLAKDFAVLLFVAALVASPVAWWLMQQWLQGFTYRVSPSIQLTGFAIALSASVALVTIAFQIIRASRSNPVDALRTE